MNVFSGTLNQLGIDLGSSQVKIYSKNKLLLAEASAVAVENIKGTILGFGTSALIRYHNEPANCRLIWPVQKGLMTNYELTKTMMHFFINKALHHAVSRPAVVLSTPSEISSVMHHALIDALMHAGAQHVYLISSPAAAALGANYPLTIPEATFSMVIGRDVTDCGVYCCGGVVAQSSMAFGGRNIDHSISQYMLDKYHMIIGYDGAEQLKNEFMAVTQSNQPVQVFNVRGRRVSDGVEFVRQLSNKEFYPVMQRILDPVADMVKQCFTKITPEISEDLLKNGLLLSGGTAKLTGLSSWLSSRIGIPVHVPKHPEDVVAIGCYRGFKEFNHLQHLIFNGEKYDGGVSF